MDDLRNRTLDDLRDLIAGDLLFAPIDRAPFAQDAGPWQVDPLGVVGPRGPADLERLVRYAHDRAIAIHPRGGGTGVDGGCLGPGLVVDFSRHFRRVVEIGLDQVVAQAGVVLDDLNAVLGPLGRRVGPDPVGSESATIGGLIAGGAVGVRSLAHGSMADSVVGLDVVFANGEPGRLGPRRRPGDGEPRDFADLLARRVDVLLAWHAEPIARAGLGGVDLAAGLLGAATSGDDTIDLARLLSGSEGALALITQATLRTRPLPRARAAILLPYLRLVDAAGAVGATLAEGPSACELIDRRSLSLVREAVPAVRGRVGESAGAALAVEFEGDDPAELARRVESLGRSQMRAGRLSDAPIEAARKADVDLIMALPSAADPLLMRMPGPSRPRPVIDDVIVPVPALGEMARLLQAIFRGAGRNWVVRGHAGLGRLRVEPFVDPADPADLAAAEALGAEVEQAARSLGGSAAAPHAGGGVGPGGRRRRPGALTGALREIKAAFDPHDLLNPGRPGDDAADAPGSGAGRRTWPAASGTPTTLGALPVLDDPLLWPGRSRSENVSACSGCGACRSGEPSLRMCPTFRSTRAEGASPRAHVNLIRQAASGAIDPKTWGSEEFKANSDSCIHCRLCDAECPAGVDVSSLMIEAKAAYAQEHGLTPSDWLLSRVEVWSRWASRLPILANAILGMGPTRWALDRLLGISKHRALPRAHRRSFVRRAESLGLTRRRPGAPGPRVAYFVDIIANHFDQELAEATVSVLHHAGVNVYVPRGQRGCGMPALVAGDLDHARQLVLGNIRLLAEAVREGYTVVCSEPTAALMLRREAVRLTDDLDAALVAENTMDVGDYLDGLRRRGMLPPFTEPVHARVGYHQPCHLRALGVGTPGLDLIRTIPELDATFIDRGCSGIAGTYGISRRNFRNSLRAGRGLRSRLRDPDIEVGSTECGACRMQMEQGLTKRTLHPMKLLALAYGLDPRLKQKLRRPKGKRVIS